MPNYVSHKITFDAKHAETVFAGSQINARFDFNALIPEPLQMCQFQLLSSEDEEDFPCNWLSWHRQNWGTKWNALSPDCKVDGDKAIITFDTAWDVPYPVICAFANKFLIEFEHRYFDEGGFFWGIEEWDVVNGVANRRSIRKKNEDDRRALHIELKGYDPDAVDEDEKDDE